MELSGTENITRLYPEDMGGVSLTRAAEALLRGECIRAEKRDGPGTDCTFRHESDDDVVEVEVFFESSTQILEIRGARVVEVMEVDGEPNAA
jgi:hypothetical protein